MGSFCCHFVALQIRFRPRTFSSFAHLFCVLNCITLDHFVIVRIHARQVVRNKLLILIGYFSAGRLCASFQIDGFVPKPVDTSDAAFSGATHSLGPANQKRQIQQNAFALLLEHYMLVAFVQSKTVSRNRNQHFVPRHYLRRFSFDGGRRIRLFNLEAERHVSEAPLRTQCSSDYFYTRDLRGESMLMEIEGIAEGIFKGICETRDIPPPDSGEHLDLMTVLLLMHARTQQKAEMQKDFLELVAKRTIRMSRDPRSMQIAPLLDRIRIRDRAAALRSVKSALQYPHLLYDLGLRLIIAPDRMSFVTSDHPVVFLNQAFYPVIRESEIVGTASKGLQIFLPLSPELLLLAFDQSIYRVGVRRRTYYQLERMEDCDLLNALQILNCRDNIYFRDESSLAKVREDAQKFCDTRKGIADRAKPVEIPLPGAGSGFLHVYRQSVIPPPAPWSFCKRRGPVTRKDFAIRNPDLLRLIREHSEYIQRTDRCISFDDWLDEQRMKFLTLSA
jgi:hypothetical protein